MKKQFATNLDERVIKVLKRFALENETSVNEVLEALVCDSFCSDKMAVISKLEYYRENKENELETLQYSKSLE